MGSDTAQNRLWQAAKTGDQATIRRLVYDDVDFDARDEEDRTAFNIATQYGQHKTAQTILAARQMQAMQKIGLTSSSFENFVKAGDVRKTGTNN